MIDLLKSILDDVDVHDGALSENQAAAYRKRYQAILTQAEELECLPPPGAGRVGKKEKRPRQTQQIPKFIGTLAQFRAADAAFYDGCRGALYQ